MKDSQLEEHVEQARDGDKKSLEYRRAQSDGFRVIIQRPVFGFNS